MYCGCEKEGKRDKKSNVNKIFALDFSIFFLLSLSAFRFQKSVRFSHKIFNFSITFHLCLVEKQKIINLRFRRHSVIILNRFLSPNIRMTDRALVFAVESLAHCNRKIYGVVLEHQSSSSINC